MKYTDEKSEPRKFSLRAILQLTTRLYMGDMSAIYQALNFLTGDDLYTHQLPRAMEECEKSVEEQFPQFHTEDFLEKLKMYQEVIKASDPGKGGADHQLITDGWIYSMEADYGKEFDLYPMLPYQYTHQDCLSELMDMVTPEKIVVFNL